MFDFVNQSYLFQMAPLQLAMTGLVFIWSGFVRGSLGFGGLIMLGTMIPIANIFIFPIAVVSATVYWAEAIQNQDIHRTK